MPIHKTGCEKSHLTAVLAGVPLEMFVWSHNQHTPTVAVAQAIIPGGCMALFYKQGLLVLTSHLRT